MEHRQVAVECFNEAWNFLDKEVLTKEDKAELLHLVHTSRYHWGHAGTDLQKGRGEWQISRAYVKLEEFNLALLHAELYLEYCEKAKLEAFDYAFAYESIARAKAGLGVDFTEDFDKAMAQAELIESKDDRDYTIGEIKSIRG